MRRHLSVLALWARGTLGWVLGVLAAMAAAETALFWRVLAGSKGETPAGIDGLLAASGVYWACAIAFVMVMALLVFSGCEFQGSRLSYTLRRLSIREEAAVLWQAGYHLICLLLFWAVQTAVLLGLCLWYTRAADPAYVSGQTVFLAFYRIGLLHGLLPLEDWGLYLRNIVFLLALAVDGACAGLRQRRGGSAAMPLFLALLAVWFVPDRFAMAGGLDAGLAMACAGLIPLAIDLAYLRTGRGEEAAAHEA